MANRLVPKTGSILGLLFWARTLARQMPCRKPLRIVFENHGPNMPHCCFCLGCTFHLKAFVALEVSKPTMTQNFYPPPPPGWLQHGQGEANTNNGDMPKTPPMQHRSTFQELNASAMVAALVPIGPRQFQTDACSLLKFGPLSHIQPKRWQGHCGPIALCFVTFLASRNSMCENGTRNPRCYRFLPRVRSIMVFWVH